MDKACYICAIYKGATIINDVPVCLSCLEIHFPDKRVKELTKAAIEATEEDLATLEWGWGEKTPTLWGGKNTDGKP